MSPREITYCSEILIDMFGGGKKLAGLRMYGLTEEDY